jgi:hypothetical protein
VHQNQIIQVPKFAPAEMGLPTYDTLPFPYEATPSSLAIKPTSPNINGFLTVGDCVALSPFDETILPKGSGVFPLQFTCGRIIDVRHSLASVCGALHPLVFADNTAKNLGSPGFRIQLYFGPGTGSSKKTLPELIESNISVWVSYRHIDKIIIILHDNDVTRHTFGSVAGRRDHFIVRDRHLFPDLRRILPLFRQLQVRPLSPIRPTIHLVHTPTTVMLRFFQRGCFTA